MNDDSFKICSVCKQNISIKYFNVNKSVKSGLKSRCKTCDNAYAKTYRETNRVKLNEVKRLFYIKNKHREKEVMHQYYIANSTKIKAYTAAYEAKRLKEDFCFKLKKALRHRLRMAIRNSQKNGSAVRDLGCTVEELKVYLESKFQPGMSWDNWSRDGWHIDHIVPLKHFDVSDPEQLRKVCHYTNLQPLWAIDNFRKGSKIIEEFKLEE